MPANKNAVVRYIILDRMLSDQHHYYTRTQLLNAVNDSLKGIDEALQVSKRTIEMDLRDMEDIFQIDLDESKIINGKKIIWYADQTRSIFSKPLSDDEKMLLNEVLSTLGQFSGLDNFVWLDDLKTKLGNQVSFGGSEFDTGSGTPQRKVISFSSNEFLQNKEYLGWFFSAITNKKVVSITYRKFDAESAQEIIAYPYMLKQYRDRWYLLCTITYLTMSTLLYCQHKGARTICSAVTTTLHRGQPWSTPCLPPARHTASMNGRGLRMSCAGSRNTNRQGKTTQTFFPETGAHCLQSNSNQYHTPIKRLQPASH